MMDDISSDLSPLFDPKRPPGVQFGQGLITAWDPTTGANTVEWAGGTLTDVPILNTGEAVALRAGHVVGMLGQGLTWFIIGRITPIGDPNFASASVAFDAKNGLATGFSLGTTIAPKVSCTLDVPSWADEVAVIAVGACVLVNTYAPGGVATADWGACVVYIDGANGPSVQSGFAALGNSSKQDIQSLTTSSSRVFQPAGSMITCELQVRSTTGAWPAHASNVAEISAMAIFRSTV